MTDDEKEAIEEEIRDAIEAAYNAIAKIKSIVVAKKEYWLVVERCGHAKKMLDRISDAL